MRTPGLAGASSPDEVTLRDAQPADLPILFEYQCDPAWRGMARVRSRSRSPFDEAWGKILQDQAAGVVGVVQKAILLNGVVCGTIGCRMQDGRCTIGYGLGKAHWGRGIATRALERLLGEVALRPLFATTAATNTASIRVLQKHGFVIVASRAAPATERCLPREEVSLMLA